MSLDLNTHPHQQHNQEGAVMAAPFILVTTHRSGRTSSTSSRREAGMWAHTHTEENSS